MKHGKKAIFGNVELAKCSWKLQYGEIKLSQLNFGTTFLIVKKFGYIEILVVYDKLYPCVSFSLQAGFCLWKSFVNFVLWIFSMKLLCVYYSTDELNYYHYYYKWNIPYIWPNVITALIYSHSVCLKLNAVKSELNVLENPLKFLSIPSAKTSWYTFQTRQKIRPFNWALFRVIRMVKVRWFSHKCFLTTTTC